MVLRPHDPEASDAEIADRHRQQIEDLLRRMQDKRITVGKLTSGERGGHPTLAEDIRVKVEPAPNASDGMLLTVSLASSGEDGSQNPGKKHAYYDEFQEFVERVLGFQGTVVVFGPRLNGNVADREASPIISYTLTHAESPHLGEKLMAMQEKLGVAAKRRDMWRPSSGGESARG